MISYIRLHNFKSFSDVYLDLRGAYGVPKKVSFIYGENGSGKSNLMLSMLFLYQSFSTRKNQIKWQNTELSDFEMNQKEIPEEVIQLFKSFRIKESSLSEIIKNYWMIDNDASMEVEIGFYHKSKSGHYYTRFSKDRITEEKLYFTVNERAGVIFSITESENKLSPSVFFDPKYKKEIVDNIEKYWGKHTLMSILYGELETKNMEYINKRVSSVLISVLEILQKGSVLYKGSSQEAGRFSVPYRFLQNLDSGEIKSQNNSELLAFEKALNIFFTQLYSDIKEVHYVFSKKEEGYHYELYFDKICGERVRSIPVSLESTGTKKLLDIFPLLFACICNSTVFIDEIDTGIHDLLMTETVSILKESLDKTEEGQIIATTHNTLLLDTLEPESIYVLQSKVNGEKEICSIADYGIRTQKNNSVRHKYLKGLYQGIPETGYLDLGELVSDINFNLNEQSEKEGD